MALYVTRMPTRTSVTTRPRNVTAADEGQDQASAAELSCAVALGAADGFRPGVALGEATFEVAPSGDPVRRLDQDHPEVLIGIGDLGRESAPLPLGGFR